MDRHTGRPVVSGQTSYQRNFGKSAYALGLKCRYPYCTSDPVEHCELCAKHRRRRYYKGNAFHREHPGSRLSTEDVYNIRTSELSDREIGKAYGLDRASIRNIRRGATFKSLKYEGFPYCSDALCTRKATKSDGTCGNHGISEKDLPTWRPQNRKRYA